MIVHSELSAVLTDIAYLEDAIEQADVAELDHRLTDRQALFAAQQQRVLRLHQLRLREDRLVREETA